MKLHDPTRPYVINVTYNFHFEPKTGTDWAAWDKLDKALWKMAYMKRYNGVSVESMAASPASFPYFTLTADRPEPLQKFLDRAFELARRYQVRIHR